MKLRTRIRALFIIALLVCCIWITPDPTLLIIGGVLIAIGAVIHFISAGYLVKQEKLITAGPYSRVRNPFYTASFLTDVGLCLAASNIFVAVIYLPLFYLWIIPRRTRKEEEFLGAQFGEKYAEYLRLVPRFFPRLTPAPLAEPFGQFEWRLILKYREQWRLLKMLGLIALFYLRMAIGNAPDWSTAISALSKPLNLAIAIALTFILIFPPLYEFIIRKLWKAKE